MLRHLRLIALFLRLSLQNDAAYRLDFFLRVGVALLQFGGELLALWTIFSNTRSLAGWSAPEVVVLLGVFRVMDGLIGMCIAPNMRRIMHEIRDGTLDFVLLRPLDSQFYASFRTFIVWRITDLVLGVVLTAAGAWYASPRLSPDRLLLFMVMLAAGATIVYSFWLILATTVFWFTRISNIEMVFWNAFEAGRYPIDIYHPVVRWMLTFVLPLAFLTTFPAGVLTGKTGWAGLAAALLVAPLMLAAASWFWRFGLRHYSGASA
jgi:ABC-2 type transport system permease protein